MTAINKIQLMNIVNYPQTPVPIYLAVRNTNNNDIFELLFGISNGFRNDNEAYTELGTFKIFKNGNLAEYGTTAIDKNNYYIEIYNDKNEYGKCAIPLPEKDVNIYPFEYNSNTDHFSNLIKNKTKELPKFELLKYFSEWLPKSVYVESTSKMVFSYDSTTKEFDPKQLLMSISCNQNKALGLLFCLAGVVGVATCLGAAAFMAVMLYCSDAH